MRGPAYLIDTNVLLRLGKAEDPRHGLSRAAVALLRKSGVNLCYTSQILAEFWNVSTRPIERNGFGLTTVETDSLVREIEGNFTLLPDSPAVHHEWRRLVVLHQIKGVQVHDARLVAAMGVQSIRHILTFNEVDFQRYPDVLAVNPVIFHASHLIIE